MKKRICAIAALLSTGVAAHADIVGNPRLDRSSRPPLPTAIPTVADPTGAPLPTAVPSIAEKLRAWLGGNGAILIIAVVIVVATILLWWGIRSHKSK